jgi:hypothetical protein
VAEEFVIGGGALGVALALWKFRAPAWHAVTKAAIAIAQEDCEKRLSELETRLEAKYDAKLDVLLRVIDARAPDPYGKSLTISGIRDVITATDDNSPTISISPPTGTKL